MTKIFLVRHGQDEDNSKNILNSRRDTELTTVGREQAKIVASKLKNDNIQVIYSSPLKRAYETAKIIAEELGIVKVVIEDLLIERDFGILTGKSRDDIPKYAKKILSTDKVDYFLEVEGAEDFPTLYKRAKAVIKKILKKHLNQNVVLVTHGDIGKMIRAAYHDWTWKEGLKTPYFDNTSVLELSKKEDMLE